MGDEQQQMIENALRAGARGGWAAACWPETLLGSMCVACGAEP